ncbi:DUF4214 domain-containing protein [Pseudoduganella sp. LjRoot289]|uniref:DUF4214 domain-containing protein n=1 Tax=Pseudoduganella sp. LjRoot289 TaxID=3342314 RepID=UPI003ECC36C6
MALTDDYPANSTTAGALPADGQTSGVFETVGDSDWFKVTLTAGSLYTYNLAAPSTSGTYTVTTLRLLRADGSYVAGGSELSGGAVLYYKPAVSGDYYVQAGKQYGASDELAYTLKSSSVIDSVGDTDAAAQAIALGQSVSSALEGGSDVDKFGFDVQAGVTYTVSASPAAGGNPLSISGPSGTTAGATGSGSGSYSFTAWTSGTAYAAISPYYSSSTGVQPYTMTVTAAADDYSANTSGAGKLTVGASTGAKFNTINDRDWFAVDLQAGSNYWFTLTGGSSYYSKLKLFDGSGKEMAATVTTDPLSGVPLLAVTASQAGTYYLEASDTGSGIASYAVAARLGARDDHGSSSATATALKAGVAASGKLELASDTDAFKLAMKAGTTYIVELAGDAASANNLTLGGKTNISALDWYTYSVAGKAAYRVFTPNQDGDVLLTVGENNTYRATAYTLKAYIPANDDYMAGSGTSGVLAMGGKASGALDFAGDQDWIKVSLIAGGKYMFQLAGAVGGGGTLEVDSYAGTLALYDASGSFQPLATMSGMKAGYYSATASKSGDYYLNVAPYRYSSTPLTGSYTLHATDLSGDTTGPAVTAFSPAKGGTGASLSANIVLGFDEAVRRGDGLIRLLDSSGAAVETFNSYSGGTATVSGNTLTINPAAPLRPNTEYTLELANGSLIDLAGNKYAGSSNYSFTTVAAVAVGGSGNDTMVGLGNGRRLNGADGIDTVVYANSSSNYTVIHINSETKVSQYSGGALGDMLSNVERLLFSNTSVALDIDGSGGQVYRLYQAAFNRAPDKSGLGYWMAQMDAGAPLKDVAGAFIGSAEFQKLYGSGQSDAAYITSMYSNVLHRAPDQAGVAFWGDSLAQGTSRANMLTDFSESAENQLAALKLIGNGFEYTPYG